MIESECTLCNKLFMCNRDVMKCHLSMTPKMARRCICKDCYNVITEKEKHMRKYFQYCFMDEDELLVWSMLNP